MTVTECDYIFFIQKIDFKFMRVVAKRIATN